MAGRRIKFENQEPTSIAYIELDNCIYMKYLLATFHELFPSYCQTDTQMYMCNINADVPVESETFPYPYLDNTGKAKIIRRYFPVYW